MSGGVDSVVMLDKLAARTDPASLVVAHFDHGIRSDSAWDARFVEGLTKKYNLKFELGYGKLTENSSEDTARQARHRFFKELSSKYRARVATAHTKDDLIETAVINLLRGTGRTGLTSLKETELFIRPLLNLEKAEIYSYAVSRGLEWLEDPTNAELKYFRNKVRWLLIPKLRKSGQKLQLESVLDKLKIINPEIDEMLFKLAQDFSEKTKDHNAIDLKILNLDNQIVIEVVRKILLESGAQQLDSHHLLSIYNFMTKAKPGDRFNQISPLHIQMDKEWLLIN